MSATTPVVRLQHVVKTYHAGAIDVAAIQDISLDIPSHRFMTGMIKAAGGRSKVMTLDSARIVKQEFAAVG